MKYAFLTLLLSGCASVIGNTPSFEYCTDITYTRHGNQIDVTAKCNAPIGGSSLPLPVPIK